MKYMYMEVSAQGRYAFVPAERGRWIKTHMSALFVACGDTNCKAKVGEPCVSLPKLASFDRRVYQVRVHPERMSAYAIYKQKLAEKRTDAGGKVIKMKGKRSG